jgi:hypothetical protein
LILNNICNIQKESNEDVQELVKLLDMGINIAKEPSEETNDKISDNSNIIKENGIDKKLNKQIDDIVNNTNDKTIVESSLINEYDKLIKDYNKLTQNSEEELEDISKDKNELLVDNEIDTNVTNNDKKLLDLLFDPNVLSLSFLLLHHF